jgi:endoglucanase
MILPKRLLPAFLILILLINACSSVSEFFYNQKSISPANQDHYKDAFEINQILGKGINLGNALEAPVEGDWGMIIQEEYIDLIADAGFQSVRIPIQWSAQAKLNPPYAIEPSFFDRIDEVIRWSLDRNLAVMINIQHYNELMADPKQHLERFLSIWDQLANHYKNYPETVVFELLNEPHENYTSDLWNSHLLMAIDTIRRSNPKRIIVVGTTPWGSFDGLQTLKIPETDRQIIATVHYYNPFQFTHQGVSWEQPASNDWLGTTWRGTNLEKNDIDQDFDRVLQWAKTFNRPIHLGEFGTSNTVDQESRMAWVRYVAESAESRDFSWAYWEFGATFGLYDRTENKWRYSILESLLPDSPEL